MTPKSTRRSPNRRLNSTCSRTPKVRGLRHNANNSNTRPPHQRTQLPLYYLRPMRGNHDRLNLSPPNRPKVPNCLLICQPHRPSCRRNFNPNPLGLYRRPNPYNCPRSNIFRPILPGKHQLRTNPQPDNTASPRTTNSTSPDNNMMIFRQHCQPSITPTP